MSQNSVGDCLGFTADIYLKIFEDKILNNFDKLHFFLNSQIFVRYLQIKIRDSLWYSKLLRNNEYFLIFSTILYKCLQNMLIIILIIMALISK